MNSPCTKKCGKVSASGPLYVLCFTLALDLFVVTLTVSLAGGSDSGCEG